MSNNTDQSSLQKKHKKSLQRKIILEELQKLNTHPTAKQLYAIVQKRLPDIGLATIYRNLDFLEKNAKIIKLQSRDKEARYDGKAHKHCHLICSCGRIMDLMDVEEIIIKSEQLTKSGFKVNLNYAEVFGDCGHCK